MLSTYMNKIDKIINEIHNRTGENLNNLNNEYKSIKKADKKSYGLKNAYKDEHNPIENHI